MLLSKLMKRIREAFRSEDHEARDANLKSLRAEEAKEIIAQYNLRGNPQSLDPELEFALKGSWESIEVSAEDWLKVAHLVKPTLIGSKVGANDDVHYSFKIGEYHLLTTVQSVFDSGPLTDLMRVAKSLPKTGASDIQQSRMEW